LIERKRNSELAGLVKYVVRFQGATKAIMWISYVALTFMTLMIVVDVFGRFVFNRPLPATVDMTELVMPYIIFICLAYTLATGGHVRVSLLLDRVPPRARAGFEIFVSIVGFVVFGLITTWAWFHFWHSFLIREQMLAPIYLPWFMGKLAMPIGCALFSIQFLIQLMQALSHISTKIKV